MNLLVRATCFLISFLAGSVAMAQIPVTLSGPIPAIQSNYAPGTNTTIIYTITNNVPHLRAPIKVNGLSNPVNRVVVSNDCGGYLPSASSTCQIGIQISPQTGDSGHSINQTLSIDYKGRVPLTNNMSFLISSENVSLISIAISPTNPTLFAGNTLNFTAIGTYSNATTLDLTYSVTWNSTVPSVAVISNAPGQQGLATGISPGSSDISATDTLHSITSNIVTLNVSGCAFDSQCPSGKFCFPPICTISCGSNSDCPVGQSCITGRCTV